MVKEKIVAKFADCNRKLVICQLMKTQKIYFFLCIAALVLSVISCNSDDDVDDYVAYQSVRVKSFSLEKNDSVLANLDTVFFTIDLTKGLIYNADSLPVGTDVSALIANMTFDNVGDAMIYIEKGNPAKVDSINYRTNPKDSIDFTGKVTMKVTAENGRTTKMYSLKVNVHQANPDSLYWTGHFGVRPLPSGADVNVEAQKSIYYNKQVYTYIAANSVYTLYITDDPYGDDWAENGLNLSFEPNLQSIVTTDEAMYMLSTGGELFSSTDGVEWTSTGANFYSLQGAWKSRVLGVVLDNDIYKHDYYPRPEGFTPVEVASDFPITGSSPMVTFVSEYDLDSPQSIMVGGRTAANTLTGATWGYDGSIWAQLQGVVTPCEGAVLFPYFTFKTDEYWMTTKYSAWILIGGRTSSGVSSTVYLSLNNGNTWAVAPVSMTMPAYIKPRAFASVAVVDADYQAGEASSLWKLMPPVGEVTRGSDYQIPYIYLFGGENNSGKIYNEMWRGAIGRLTYPPIP